MPVFVDTNVLVYARDASERTKQPLALAWVTHLWQTRSGRLSYQILQEYYVTVTAKLSPGLGVEEARSDVRALLAWRPLVLSSDLLEAAWALIDRFALSFWDSLVVAAAKAGGCDRLLSEDLQHNQVLDGVRIVNPFLVTPEG